MFTIGLASIRFRLLKFPFSPLGFAVANAYGTMTPYWGPFFVVWLLKAVILKSGGAPLYKRFVPFFLGLVVGQYFTAGIVWTTISVFANPEVSSRFHLSIGG
jgi:hypothetical protein